MAVPADAVAGVVQSATANAAAIERANEQVAAQDPDAPPSDAFDVWRHTAAGIPDQMDEAPAETWRAAADAPSREWAATDGDGVGDSLEQQAADARREFDLLTGRREPGEGEAGPGGVLSGVGMTFGLLTSLEQMISAPLSVLPFPAFPALRVTDMDIGLPHAHTHPPNLVPPAPPTPFPSTGPIIPIPFLSGATRTLINGMPAARCGDMGLGVWCGGYFPMYEVFLGSSSVWIEGARAGRLLVDVTRHCMFSSPKPSDPPLGPMVGMTITASPNVLVGGVPMPSLLNLAMGAAMQGLFKGLGKAVKRARAWRAADEVGDAASRMSRGGGSSIKPRPTWADNMQRLYVLCGKDLKVALRVRAAAEKLVDDLVEEGVIHVGGDAIWRGRVMEDLYMVASSRTGKRQLEEIADSGQTISIRPLADAPDPQFGPAAYPRGASWDPNADRWNRQTGQWDRGAGDWVGEHQWNPTTQKKGAGTGTDIHYRPDRYEAPESPPDLVLVHELAHANSNAHGTNMMRTPPSPGARTAFPEGEEERVVRTVENAYRAEFGLTERTSYWHTP